MHHISLDAQDQAVQRFFLALTVNPDGAVVELNGQAVACVVPPPTVDGAAESAWSEAKNERRCNLIDREIDGTLTPMEAVELHGLQQAMLRHRRHVAPLPLAAARQLHRRLSDNAPPLGSGR